MQCGTHMPHTWHAMPHHASPVIELIMFHDSDTINFMQFCHRWHNCGTQISWHAAECIQNTSVGITVCLNNPHTTSLEQVFNNHMLFFHFAMTDERLTQPWFLAMFAPWGWNLEHKSDRGMVWDEKRGRLCVQRAHGGLSRVFFRTMVALPKRGARSSTNVP